MALRACRGARIPRGGRHDHSSHVRTMDQMLAESLSRQNFNALLLTIFAGIALLLAAIGIYGLMSYSVEQRMQEIGIRVALGASRGDVFADGAARDEARRDRHRAGPGGAYGATRLLASLLFGVKANDPDTFAAVAAVVTLVAAAATFVRRGGGVGRSSFGSSAPSVGGPLAW